MKEVKPGDTVICLIDKKEVTREVLRIHEDKGIITTKFSFIHFEDILRKV